MRWYVCIYERKDEGADALETKLGPYTTERIAERAERGVNRNLDHDRFYTGVVDEEDEDGREGDR